MKNLGVLVALAAAVVSTQTELTLAQDDDSRLEKTLEEALNKQINAELESSYLYLSMAAYFESVNLEGFAHWMRIQTQEETTHGMMFFDYINERNGRVLLTKLEGPETEWDSPLDAFQAAYEHEKKISSLINKLVVKARDLRDDSTDNFLQWFVAEQVEEETAAYRIVQQLKLVGDDRAGLFLIDRELAQRQPPQPTPPVAPGL
jgi:ferritin